jgi:Cd2+/Zn2+-exporting ATPase
VEGTIDGERFIIGSVEFVDAAAPVPGIADALVSEMIDAGATVLALARDDGACREMVALIAVEDEVRPEARETVRALAGSGIERTVMLTGDNARAAARVASATGVSEYRAGLLPGEKAEIVSALQSDGAVVAVVGDGINDAPALAAADVGIAGAAGSDTAIDVADIALMHDHLLALPHLFGLGRRTMRVIRQNITLSLAAKAVVFGLAAAGHASLGLAGLADAGVARIVIANSLRLMRTA